MYIKATGLDQTASNNRVTIGPYECVIPGNLSPQRALQPCARSLAPVLGLSPRLGPVSRTCVRSLAPVLGLSSRLGPAPRALSFDGRLTLTCCRRHLAPHREGHQRSVPDVPDRVSSLFFFGGSSPPLCFALRCVALLCFARVHAFLRGSSHLHFLVSLAQRPGAAALGCVRPFGGFRPASGGGSARVLAWGAAALSFSRCLLQGRAGGAIVCWGACAGVAFS